MAIPDDVKRIEQKLDQAISVLSGLAADIKVTAEYAKEHHDTLFRQGEDGGLVRRVEINKITLAAHERIHAQEREQHDKEINRHRFNITAWIAILSMLGQTVFTWLSRK